jgi:hypothetical protein
MNTKPRVLLRSATSGEAHVCTAQALENAFLTRALPMALIPPIPGHAAAAAIAENAMRLLN